MTRLIVPWRYTGILQRMIKKIKYRSNWAMVEEIGEMLIAQLSINNFQFSNKDWIVTSVPMWERKKRERGFNQAEKLGRLLAKKWGLKYVEMLKRVKNTRAMYGLTKEQRGENVKGVFRLNSQIINSQMCTNNKKIILVDDVWTTGATMRECARVLKRAGVTEVLGVTIAR